MVSVASRKMSLQIRYIPMNTTVVLIRTQLKYVPHKPTIQELESRWTVSRSFFSTRLLIFPKNIFLEYFRMLWIPRWNETLKNVK